MIDSRFSMLDHLHEKNKVGKKMGYISTNTTMTSLMSPKGTGKSAAASQTGNVDSQSFQSAGHDKFQSLAPSADADVTNAWYKAAQETGVNDFKGTNTQLSALFAIQAEQRAETGNSDVLGKTKETAASAVKKAIARLNSMSGEKVNTKVKEYRAQEMGFYQALLSRLEG